VQTLKKNYFSFSKQTVQEVWLSLLNYNIQTTTFLSLSISNCGGGGESWLSFYFQFSPFLHKIVLNNRDFLYACYHLWHFCKQFT
jgi:hypothetical protein